jgi:RimJ/RimL family protein N-acetyltransferase
MLRGNKVTLRAIERDDQRIFWVYNNDLEIELLSSSDPPMPLSLAASLAFFDRRLDEPKPNHWFAIEAGAEVIGACGLKDFDATARTCGLGIRIGERIYWGKGYGRDAVATLLDYGFRHLSMHKVWLTVLDSNERAIRSYKACGFEQEALLRRHIWMDGSTRDELVMGVLASEWHDPRRSGRLD